MLSDAVSNFTAPADCPPEPLSIPSARALPGSCPQAPLQVVSVDSNGNDPCSLAYLVRNPLFEITLTCGINDKRLFKDFSSKCVSASAFTDESISGRQMRYDNFILHVEEDTFVVSKGVGYVVIVSRNRDKADAWARRLRKEYRQRNREHSLLILRAQEGRISLGSADIDRSRTPVRRDLDLLYGPGMVDWSNRWIDTLKQRRSSLTVFQGPPGTGKTSFIRYVVDTLKRTHRPYCLPEGDFYNVAAPELMDLWLRERDAYPQKGLLLIIEDAEALLREREGGSQAGVSALLNMTDGLWADGLRVHVFATTNVEVGDLDPAILRPGRLVSIREFSPLERTAAENIVAAKGLTPLPPDRDRFTLAELFNAPPEGVCSAKRKIGFGNPPMS